MLYVFYFKIFCRKLLTFFNNFIKVVYSVVKLLQTDKNATTFSYYVHAIFFRTSGRISNSKIFLGLCPALSGSTNVAKRLDVIVYPGNIRRVTGHARPECATSIRFQLITARTWCVGRQPPPPCTPPACLTPPSPIFVLQSLLQSSIQFRIPIHPSNVGFRVWLDDFGWTKVWVWMAL